MVATNASRVLIASPPTATSQTHNSSKVASGVCRKQTLNWARLGHLGVGRVPNPAQGRHTTAGTVAVQELSHERERNTKLVGHRLMFLPNLAG